MKKKLRKLLKNNLKSAATAFSLVELSVSLIVIAVIIAVLTPVISKRLTAVSSVKNRISTDCDPYYPDGYCAMCYINPKSCVSCTKSCNSNQYKNVSSCVCEDCSVRYNDSHCSKCNSRTCLQCDNGYYLNNNHKCTICPQGYYCYQNADESIKAPCAKGTAAPDEGMSACNKCLKSNQNTTGTIATSLASINCTNCTNGKYASIESQSSECNICPKGYYCPSGKLIPCPQGTANNLKGQIACSNCIASTSSTQGTVASSQGQISCTLCGDGSYASQSKQTTNCTLCPVGYYCPQGKIIPCPKGYTNNSTGQSVCVGCRKSANGVQGNVAVSQGQASCSACTNGTYAKIDKQTTVCSKCPAGYACSNGTFAQCSAGYYSYAGSGACIACPSGSTSNTGASGCVNCAIGCSACSITSSNCTSCKAGYYKNANSCIICPAGYYCVGGNAGRIACPSGTASAARASSYKKCSDFGDKCVACSVSGCTRCADGYKVDGVGCKAAWNCADAGGKIKGDICYMRQKVINSEYEGPGTKIIDNCAKINDGHTWHIADMSEVKYINDSTCNGLSCSASSVFDCTSFYWVGDHKSCNNYTQLCYCLHPAEKKGYKSSCYSNSCKNSTICITYL